jgi:adenylate kinase family enzyme
MMRRVNVIGTSCSGKTTLARSLAERLGLPCVEFDALFWGPSWTEVPTPVFRERLRTALGGDGWVADGSYASHRDISWERVDTVVWLDYPLHLVLGRWVRRTVSRIRSQEEFWPGTGNRESVQNALRREGLLWWILRTHGSRRQRTLRQLAAAPHIRLVRLRSPADTERWLATL